MKSSLKLTVKTEILPLVLVIGSFIASFYFYAHFPEQVPIHWDLEGKVNGYGSAAFAAFFLPFVNLCVYLLFLLLPVIDPKKDRYKEFATPYHVFKNVIVAFLTLMYFLTSFNGLGYPMPIEIIVPASVGILFAVMGSFMGKLKSNWMMGVRTPWTLSSENVWNKTNELSGKLFVVCGVLLFLSAFTSNFIKMGTLIVSIVLLIVIPVFYSWTLYNREKKGQ